MFAGVLKIFVPGNCPKVKKISQGNFLKQSDHEEPQSDQTNMLMAER